jgi:predicted anti-sigma-YlaC factor YlaD
MSEHDRDLLGAYALGVLDPDEVTAIDQHVASCADCRHDLAELVEMKDSLGEVPPEAFLDGPPEGGDLLLQRTLRAVRADKTRSSRQRLSLVAAGVVALATVAAGAGVLVGRGNQTTPQVLPPAPSATAPSTPVGVRTVSATDATTGASINATVTPAAGWVRVHADVSGIKAGKRCQLIVLTKRGTPMVAGSWLVSEKGESEGTKLDGSAIVSPNDVAAVQVITFDNEKLVSAPI